ncbi:pi4K (nucleomorph) [Hemiselmis andersenii]|uniref:Pi4K n=2 Tax=Hemiselmis andersenii TaxID=464988 RepID=A9BL86_HEMAN|nr:pi4K [Hemiselmis andersenii]ABW98269.1 pi4K [Hemiselmis andersenii]
MKLCNYFLENFKNLKSYTEKNPKKFLDKEIKFRFDFFWIQKNHKKNLNFFSRTICYLNSLIRTYLDNKNLISQIFLMKFRKESLLCILISKKKHSFRNFFFDGNLINFNKLNLVPIKKFCFFKKFGFQSSFSKKRFKSINKIKKFCFCSFPTKFGYTCLKFSNFSFFKVGKIKFDLIRKINLLCNEFWLLSGFSNLISIHRKWYRKPILILYLKLGFLKISTVISKNFNGDFFRHLENKKKSVKNLKKFEPFLLSIFRLDLEKPACFSKIIPWNFEILPSKSKIPLKICLEFFHHIAFYKKKIMIRNSVLTLKPKEKNLPHKKKKIFKKNFNFDRKNSFNSCFLFKRAEDFSNEEFVTIHLSQFDKIFREEQLNIWINPFLIQSLSFNSGFMELIPNSISIHDLRKIFGNSKKINNKKKNPKDFVESLIGYSLVCFFIQIKDRHNANILINPQNRHIHIDFGFILGNYPGNLKFEANTFKFSPEFLSQIGGKKTESYEEFKEIFIRGFFCVRKNFSKIFRISRKFLIHKVGYYSKKNKLVQFQKRINIAIKDNVLIKYILFLIEESVGNWKTIQYDRYQLYASGIK